MSNSEVGRWKCAKCAGTIVATGPRFKGNGGFSGPCPWDCGAYINRSFRLTKPGEVRVCRADEWDQRAFA